MLYVILIVSILASLYELKKLKEQHYTREMVISLVLLAIGTILTLLYIFHIELPSPLMVIQFLFQPISELLV